MPVVNVNLVLDEATYKGVMDGALELYGMVKDQKHRVRKHLPTVFDSAKEGASKAIDIVRNREDWAKWNANPLQRFERDKGRDVSIKDLKLPEQEE